MIHRIRLTVLLARPAVLVLLGLFAVTGMARAGHGEDFVLSVMVLVVVFGFLLFSVACNDLADEAIDIVNLSHDRSRPLVSGFADRHDLVSMAGISAVVAIVVSATLGLWATVTTVVGLAVSAGYSLRPVRVADRGAVASLVLPACYVAMPYLVGVFAVRPVRPADLVLLAGLYVAFIGRILLKDFRDVRGDALFGKRTFLVRHGRRWTCLFSGCCWTVGAVVLVVTAGRPMLAFATGYAVGTGLVLALLYALSVERGARRDERLISAIAIVGRGMVVILLAHLTMTNRSFPTPLCSVVVGSLVALTVGQVVVMLRHGPVTRTTVPFDEFGGSDASDLSRTAER